MFWICRVLTDCVIFHGTALGIWMVSVSFMGYVMRPLSWLNRALLLMAGATMFMTDGLGKIGVPPAILGLVLAGAPVGIEWNAGRRQASDA